MSSNGVERARALREPGEAERKRGNLAVAQQHYEDAVAAYRGTGETQRLAHTIRHLGDVYYSEQRADLAAPCFHEALDLYRTSSETAPLDLANAIRSLAVLESETGDPDRARALWEEARDLYSSLNVSAGVKESSARLELRDR